MTSTASSVGTLVKRVDTSKLIKSCSSEPRQMSLTISMKCPNPLTCFSLAAMGDIIFDIIFAIILKDSMREKFT